MIKFVLKHPRMTHEMLGFIPGFLSENDPRPAKEQIDSAYRHGGGWSKFDGFKMTPTALIYSGDPPMKLLAEARLRHEVLRFYEGEWLAIIQPDGSHEIARLS